MARPPHELGALGLRQGRGHRGAGARRAKRNALTTTGLTQNRGLCRHRWRLPPAPRRHPAERALAVATIRNNQLVVLDPAPRSFGGFGFDLDRKGPEQLPQSAPALPGAHSIVHAGDLPAALTEALADIPTPCAIRAKTVEVPDLGPPAAISDIAAGFMSHPAPRETAAPSPR